MTAIPEIEVDVGAPAYQGLNAAHRSFFSEFKYLNAFYYLFVSAKDKLRLHLESAVADADRGARERGRPEALALCVVTHPISNTQFQAVVVPRADAAMMATDFDGFLRTVSRHCIVATHRLLIDYVFDLLLEIDNTSQLAIQEEDRDAIHARRASPKVLTRVLEVLGIPITTSSDLERRIRLLA